MATEQRSVSYIGPLPPTPGGIAQHGAHLVEALRLSGSDVQPLSWKTQYPPFLYKGQTLDPFATPVQGDRRGLTWWNPLSWWAAARRARSAEVVIMQWVTPFHGIPLGLILRWCRNTRRVLIVHNAIPHERLPFDERLSRFAFRGADTLVALSDEQVDKLRTFIPEAQVERVAMPSHLTGVTVEPLPQQPPVRLLHPGFVRPYKGVDISVAALARLNEADNSEFELTIAGDFWDPTPDEVADLAANLGVSDSVQMIPGYLPDAALADLIAAAHIVVLPYREATQSGLVPAALASGRPVVTTNVGALAEQVAHDVNGFVCKRPDPDEVAAAVLHVTDALKRMSEAACAADRDAIGWDQAVDQLINRR